MISDLKPYLKYKGTGQAWLGDIPEHWSLLPNRALFEEVKDRNHPDEEMLSVTITRGIVRQKTLLENSSKKDSSNLDKSAYKRVQPNEIAYNKMRAWQGAIGVSAFRGIISPAYVVMRLRDNDDLPGYFHHLFRTQQFTKEAERWSYGITSDMWSLRPEHFKLISIPQPPPSEQILIVRFLDATTGRLARAIRLKKETIALLGEHKRAIIDAAVAGKGDNSTRLKKSELNWLGDMPEHWKVPLFGRFIKKVEQGWSPVAAEGELEPDQWAVLTLSSVRRGSFNRNAIKPVSQGTKIPPGIEISDGDVLLTRSNTRDRVGDVCVVRDPRKKTILCDLIYRLRLHSGAIETDYLVYQLLSRIGRGQIERDARGSSGTMPKISQGHIKAWRILLPPVVEQIEIVKRIDRKTSPIDRYIKTLESEIELLREYGSRVVFDVVTGKLDVREAAQRLPVDSVVEPVDNTEDSETAESILSEALVE